VPAHGYTYSWEGNPNWSQAYVGSPEIFDYFQGRAKEFGVYELVRLNHAVRKATWDDVQGKWRVEIEDLKTQQTFIDEAEVLINSGGFLK
jgi:cation diffusion facilitator CzcD-associated flavoprotein CzcO